MPRWRPLVVRAVPCALDGIAMIVHPGNPLTNITSAAVRDIYEDRITTWSEVIK